MADAKGPRSLVIADLSDIANKAAPGDLRPHPVGMTVYLLSNSGQGPSLEIIPVPSGVVSFIRRAAQATTVNAWNRITQRFHPLQVKDDNGKAKRKRKAPSAGSVAGRPGWTKNPAFEDLCDIYEPGFVDRRMAAKWLHQYVLGRMETIERAVHYEETNAQTWALAELFLQEVLGMKKERIEAIRGFAERVAEWISEQRSGDGKKLLYSVLRDRPGELRRKLVRAVARHPDRPPFFTLNEFCLVWLDHDKDAWLVQDLLAISVIERLHELGHFADVAQDLPIEIEASAEAGAQALEEDIQ